MFYCPMRSLRRFAPLAFAFAVLAFAATRLWYAIAPDYRLVAGVLEAMLSAALLLPIGLRLLAAQRRGEEARRGSIVARTEGRAVAALLAAALAGLTIPAMPAAVAAVETQSEPPREALLITACAAAICLGALLLDLVASRRVRRLDAQLALGEGAASGVDFGLGDDVAERALPSTSTAYRGGGRSVTLAVGDPLQARAALQRSITRGALVLGFIEIVALGHGLARDTSAAAAYEAQLCEGGRIRSCRQAALLSERAGMPDYEARSLHQLACDTGELESCMAVYLLDRRAESSR